MTASGREDQIRRLAYELQLMQGTAEVLQQRFQVLQTALADLTVATESLTAIKESKEGEPILVPAGGGTYVNARLGDLSKVIVGIGADVSIEMSLVDAEENASGRLEEVEKASQSVQQQLEQILAQMQAHRDGINRLSASLRGEGTGV